jgi:PAS domain S-box-containing protein
METFMIDHRVQNTEQYEILIVDDTPDSLELLRRMLKEIGYRVRPAANGRHALKSVAARLPDLILLDIKMPEMDGYEVCRRLKSNEQSRNVPVLFISAHGETAKKVEGFKAGGVDFITKPFEREEVLARVETHLRLGNLTERLEQEVNQRTAELTLANQELRQQITERRRVNAQLQHELAERKQAEEKRRESEERLRLTLEATQIGIFDWDVEHDRWFASSEYYTMLGYEPKEGMGDRKEWLERVHPDDRAHVETKVREVLARESPADQSQAYEYEARLRRADGTYRWQHVKGFGVKRDPLGRVTRMLGIRMDISERKAAEEALRRLNLELDRRVLERTAELEAANKEMHAFTYTVSHDLRAPLRHIDGFLELLQKKAGAVLDDQSRHYMDTISRAARKMSLLIDDLLSFSRMGRHAMSFKPVDLEPLVHELIRDFEPDAAGRTIEWRIGDLPAVDGDAAMLRIVLSNLIANALKFTRPRQEARIEIGTLPGQASETVIFVRDNGVGFENAYADKMFGVFQRLHHTDEFEGTGIGLASVRRIVARHGGRTWAEGQPGQGAEFFFSLPQPPIGGGHAPC